MTLLSGGCGCALPDDFLFADGNIHKIRKKTLKINGNRSNLAYKAFLLFRHKGHTEGVRLLTEENWRMSKRKYLKLVIAENNLAEKVYDLMLKTLYLSHYFDPVIK